MNRDDGCARLSGLRRALRHLMLQVDLSRGCSGCHGALLLWIDAHSLSNPAFDVSPLLARAFHAPANGLYTFLFGFAEIVYKTHGGSPLWAMHIHSTQGPR